MLKKPKKARLLLIGGGLQHALLLKYWSLNGAHHPENTLDIELIAEDSILPYSPMLPDLLSGHCSSRDCSIDLRHLCTSAGARYTEGRVRKFSAANRQITLSNGQQHTADLISLDTGELDSGGENITEELMYAFPQTHFYRRWQHFKSLLMPAQTVSIAVLGNNERAVEIALALRQQERKPLKIHLLYKSEHLLPQQGFSLQQRARAELNTAGITLHPGFNLRSIDQRHQGLCVIAPDRALSVSAAIVCDHSAPPLWLQHCGLELNENTELKHNEFGQAEDYENIFICPVNTTAFDPKLAQNIEKQARSAPLNRLNTIKVIQNTIKNGRHHTLIHTVVGSFKSQLLWRWQHYRERRIVRRLNR